MPRREDPKQILIDWSQPKALAAAPVVSVPAPPPPPSETLVERLPWDFRSTFPQPTDQAIDSGIIDESDLKPQNLAALHQCYAKQCLATLTQLDRVLDARRRGVDGQHEQPVRGERSPIASADESCLKQSNSEGVYFRRFFDKPLAGLELRWVYSPNLSLISILASAQGGQICAPRSTKG